MFFASCGSNRVTFTLRSAYSAVLPSFAEAGAAELIEPAVDYD
jgi:hypothetical protein